MSVRLAEHHRAQLRASAIVDDVADERGYFSVERASELGPLGFGLALRFAPTLVVPIHGVVKDEPSWFMHRPDETPVIDGNPRKYQIPAGQRMTLDVHPRSLPWLGDPGRALLITEGSKKVDALVSAGANAVVGLVGVWNWRGTNGAGGKTLLADWEHVALNDRQVFVVFDSDVSLKQPVRLAMERLGGLLGRRGASVRYVYLPPGPNGVKVGADDYLAEGHTLRDLAALATPELRPASGAKPSSARRVSIRGADTVAPEPVQHLWADRWPLGALSLEAGEGGLGKSTLLAERHARLSVGELDGELIGESGYSLIITAEDHIASVVVPRLIAAGADLEHVGIVGVEEDAGGGLVTLPDDLVGLEQRIRETGARLLSIDPVVGALSGEIDSHKDHSIRRVLAPLAQLAERCDMAVVGVIHMNKSAVSDLLNRVSGSKGFVNAARSVVVFARDPDDPGGDEGYQRVIVHAKSNWGRLAPTLAARIEPRDLAPEQTGAQFSISTSTLVITGESSVTRADISGRESDEAGDKVDLARHWLLDRLDADRWHDSGAIKADGQSAGHKGRTLIRAFMALVDEGPGEVKSEGFPRRTYWLIHSRANPSGTTEDPEVGTTDGFGFTEPKTDGPGSSGANYERLAPLDDPGQSRPRPTVRPRQVYTSAEHPDWRLRVTAVDDGHVRVRVESHDDAAGRQFDVPREHFGTRLRRVV